MGCFWSITDPEAAAHWLRQQAHLGANSYGTGVLTVGTDGTGGDSGSVRHRQKDREVRSLPLNTTQRVEIKQKPGKLEDLPLAT